ncbi:MAG: hypothetical protein QOF02_3786 [Blastocatellia bacterium]|jgi:hypothetical protein|nr:hypothetical protein [Blastocatellia bacterium]
MTDEEFIEQFERGALSTDGFHHREHVRLVWLYLRRYTTLETLERFSAGLRRFAQARGLANLYHETTTWAYVFLIHERVERAGASQSWEEFAAANADLLNWKENILMRYYNEDTLHSETARRIFVFPDKLAQAKVADED